MYGAKSLPAAKSLGIIADVCLRDEDWAADPDDPAVVLRDRLWLPVAKHLDGVETVLVSPDN